MEKECTYEELKQQLADLVLESVLTKAKMSERERKTLDEKLKQIRFKLKNYMMNNPNGKKEMKK